MEYLQLDFFAKDNMELLRLEFERIKQNNEKTRKSLFARHNYLEREFLELKLRQEIIEKNLCSN